MGIDVALALGPDSIDHFDAVFRHCFGRWCFSRVSWWDFWVAYSEYCLMTCALFDMNQVEVFSTRHALDDLTGLVTELGRNNNVQFCRENQATDSSDGSE